jgi:hypothetical protein
VVSARKFIHHPLDMNLFITNFFLNKHWRFTVIFLVFIFLLKPLHRIVYLSTYFDKTPISIYRVNPNLKTKAYLKDNNFSLPVTDEVNKKSLKSKIDFLFTSNLLAVKTTRLLFLFEIGLNYAKTSIVLFLKLFIYLCRLVV